MPKIPLQSWSSKSDPSFLPGYTNLLNSSQSAPLQLYPLNVEISEKVSLSKSNGGRWPFPNLSTNIWTSQSHGAGFSSFLMPNLCWYSHLELILHYGFWQNPAARQATSAEYLLRIALMMEGPAKWTKASQVGRMIPSKKSQTYLSMKSVTSFLWIPM